MKKKLIIAAIAVSMLMTGCKENENKETISVPYSDMFKSSAPSTTATEEWTVQSDESELYSTLVSQTKAASFNQDIANTPIDDICYITYKADSPKKKETYHSYRVIFRTETDTYLLGTSPYKSCKWDKINSVCREIGNRIYINYQMIGVSPLEIENGIDINYQVIGVPSLKDFELLDESGIYIPGQFEMWTSTLVSSESDKAYYRNSKGSYLATKSVSKKSGVCAIIKVSTTQNDESLLSTSWANYEELKSQLESEAE